MKTCPEPRQDDAKIDERERPDLEPVVEVSLEPTKDLPPVG